MPVGIITEMDIVRRVVAESKDPKITAAYDIMSKPLITVGPEATIYDTALIMTKYSIRRLPIVRDNTLLGIITSSDLARRMYEQNKDDPSLNAMQGLRMSKNSSVIKTNIWLCSGLILDRSVGHGPKEYQFCSCKATYFVGSPIVYE